MFKIIGALVVYGLALYGLTKALEERPVFPAPGTAEKQAVPVKPLSAVK